MARSAGLDYLLFEPAAALRERFAALREHSVALREPAVTPAEGMAVAIGGVSPVRAVSR